MQHSTISSNAPEQSSQPTLLDIVMQALDATGRNPAIQPETSLPHCFTKDKITDFYIEKLNGGWVATVTFRDIPASLPNALGSPDMAPYRDHRDAFLHGASIICEIVSGSRELPFTMIGDEIIVAAHGV